MGGGRADRPYTDVAMFGGVVKSTSSPEEVAQPRASATASGLKPSMLLGGTNLGEGLEHGVDDYKRLIDNAAELGTKWLLHCGTGNEALYTDYFELMRRATCAQVGCLLYHETARRHQPDCR